MSETMTIEQLASELRELRMRVEDLEDLRDLESAIRENDGRPLMSWDAAKRDLDL
jgi:hypothetical protein